MHMKLNGVWCLPPKNCEGNREDKCLNSDTGAQSVEGSIVRIPVS